MASLPALSSASSTPSPSRPSTPAYTPQTAPPQPSSTPATAARNTDTLSDASTFTDKAADEPIAVAQEVGAGAEKGGVAVDRTASGEEVIWVDWDGPE